MSLMATITIFFFKLIKQLPVQLVWANRIPNISQMFTKGLFRKGKV